MFETLSIVMHFKPDNHLANHNILMKTFFFRYKVSNQKSSRWSDLQQIQDKVWPCDRKNVNIWDPEYALASRFFVWFLITFRSEKSIFNEIGSYPCAEILISFAANVTWEDALFRKLQTVWFNYYNKLLKPLKRWLEAGHETYLR